MRKILLFCFIFFTIISLKAQNSVGIGTVIPNSEAILELSATDKGFLMTRLNASDTSLFVGNTEGMMFYARDVDRILYYGAGQWNAVSTGGINVWDLNGNDISNNNSGNVGIGTNTPAYLFSVNGPANLNEGIASGTALRVNGSEAIWYNGTYFSWGFGGSANFFADNVGIGTTTPNGRLQFDNGLNNRKIVLFESFNNDHQFYGFGVNSGILRYQVSGNFADHVFYAAASAVSDFELMRIKGNGNVGIGNSNPQEQLVVGDNLGNIYATYTAATIGGTGTGGAIVLGRSTLDYMQIDHGSAGSRIITSNDLFLDVPNVGIGTSTPSEKLDVDAGGSIEVDGEYTYESAKTRVMWIAPNAFQSNQPHVYDYATESYSQAGESNEDAGYGYFPTGTGGADATAVTPIYLPDGAIVTELEITWHDAYLLGNLTVSLMRKSPGSINPFSLGSASSSGFGTGQTSSSTTTTPLSVSISNNSYAYYLKYAGYQGLSSTLLGLKSVKLTYTVTQAD